MVPRHLKQKKHNTMYNNDKVILAAGEAEGNNSKIVLKTSYVEEMERLSAHELISAQRAELAGLKGEIRAKERRNATLSIVQKVGALADRFSAGSIVMNKETVLSLGDTPVEFTVLVARKFYQEKVAYNSGVRPRIFSTEEDVLAAGGTLDWENGVAPTYETVLHCTVLLKQPDGVEGGFTLTYEGAQYALCEWYMRGVAFKNAGLTILNTIWQLSRSGQSFTSLKWELTTRRITVGLNKVITPAVNIAGRHSNEFTAFASTLLN